MNMYKSLGIEDLIQNSETAEKLKKHILDNYKYIVPGYKYDYFLHTFEDYLEFYFCKDADEMPIGISMHFSANYDIDLQYNNTTKDNEKECFYEMAVVGGKEYFPVKIVNSDVLSSPACGDIIRGQLVAFADPESIKTCNNIEELKINQKDDESVSIDCIPFEESDLREFEFENIKCKFWEMQVNTVFGETTLLLNAEKYKDDPCKIGAFTANAIISFDVSAGRSRPYTDVEYNKIIIGGEYKKYKNGFIPSLSNAQKLFKKCMLNNDYSRFWRACAGMVGIGENGKMIKILELPEKFDFIHYIGNDINRIEQAHVIDCPNSKVIGEDILIAYHDDTIRKMIVLSVTEKGTVAGINLFNPGSCTVGIDYELHLLSSLGSSMSLRKANTLYEHLYENCYYKSEHSDLSLFGVENIIGHMKKVEGNLDRTNEYTYDIVPSRDELCTDADLPEVYQGKWCLRLYQGGKDNLVSVVFIKVSNDKKIKSILLSKDPEFLRSFGAKNNPVIEEEDYPPIYQILSESFGKENTLDSMRRYHYDENDGSEAFVWKNADEFARNWLWNNGYKLENTEVFDDCIGYNCTRRGEKYAIFFFAFGEKKHIILDEKRCLKLKDYEISKDKSILVCYVKVEERINEDGKKECLVGAYYDASAPLLPEKLTEISGKTILQYFLNKETIDLTMGLIEAYNTKNLDLLKSIFTKDVELDAYDSNGYSLNDGFYSHLLHIRKNRGEMKPAYVRFNDVLYSLVPYIENYGYVSFDVTNNTKISRLIIRSLEEPYREMLVPKEEAQSCEFNIIPKIERAEFLAPSEISRFSIRMVFDNGEIRRYDFQGEIDKEEVIDYDGRTFTDKIFANGRINESISLPDWMGYEGYAKRGQGIEFINGFCISTAELYRDSYPIEKFNYSKLDNVQVMQFDYQDDGFGVGYIHNLDPENPYYLLDRNTMTATTLPKEYSKTPIGVYPFYGGYSEGLIMVSTIEKIELQYYHNMASCAGMWGWLDRNMNVVIEPQFIFAHNFENGRATVCKGSWDKNEENQYWCEHEQWGIIDKTGNEIVPCMFDELYKIDGTENLFLIHEGGWENGHYAVFDSNKQEIILTLDFDFDMGYMFNECFLTEDNVLVFMDHQPGEEKDFVYAYDLTNKKYLAYKQEYRERTYNGKTKVVVTAKNGEEITVF